MTLPEQIKSFFAKTPPHLLAALAPDQIDPLLANWRWFIGNDSRALFATASGDVFLIESVGRILWLNTGDGTVTPAADSLAHFQSLLESAENRENWFFEPAIDRLRESGRLLAPGQCYGFVTLPVLGGDWEGENRFPISLKEHLDLTGHIHEQIKDLPDGAEVRIDIVD